VESLGGRFIDLPQPDQSAEDKGGYAKEMGEDFLAKQREILTKHISEADAVITTALIPGRPAPKLVTEAMVAAMKPGSVVVDLAAVMGGNCPLTKPGERYVTENGVMIVGETNVAGLVPFHASEMYARNVLDVVKHLVTKEGALTLSFEDEITAGSVVTSGGRIYHGATAEALGEKVPEIEKPSAAAGDVGSASGAASGGGSKSEAGGN
jgi:NAD(P) transhydrogenase subunit alpha